MGVQAFEETHPYSFANHIANANGTLAINIVTSATLGQRIDHLWVSNSDTVDREVVLSIGPNGLTIYDVGSKIIPAGTGFATLPLVDLLNTLLPGQGGYALQLQDVIQVRSLVTVAAGKFLTFFAQGGYV